MRAMLATSLLIGVAVGWCRRGSLRNLPEHHICALWLPWLAVVLQILHFRSAAVRDFFDEQLHVSMLFVIYGAVIAWLLLNLRERAPAFNVALCVVLAGASLNAVVIAANGEMPARLSIAQAAGLPDHLIERARSSPKHVEMDESTKLPWLGDVIPFRPGRVAISAGDVVLMLGLALVLAAAMQPRRGGTEPRLRPARWARPANLASP